MALKVIDLFCGTGGFSKGFENLGAYEVKYGIDVLPLSVDTFRLNHRAAIGVSGDIRTTRRGDVEQMTGLKAGDVDVIIGGPPCQGFSSIRPFRSSKDDDPRNTLFEEFASHVNWFRPPVFVMENVVGLGTHNGGNQIESIQEAFNSLGYDTDWRILNAAHFGVPQKRERLVMIGVERGGSIQFPKPTHEGSFRTIGLAERWRMLRPGEPDLLSIDRPPLPSAVTVAEAIGDLPAIGSGEVAYSYAQPPETEYQRARRDTKLLTWHSATKHSDKMMEIIRHSGPNISCIPKHLISSGFSSCYSRLAADEPAVTMTVNFIHPASNKCIHPTLDRALTPREGARLQSYDDSFQFAGTNRGQIAKQIGNAVPPLLGKAIGRAVLNILGEGISRPISDELRAG
ncbi:DNA cytosine methyltransferase [Williamsia sp. Leaf354]|uniref:DNA cytosine methyltransferase n=1 Tax=Williamsia sp. Leaf354 TaxID=1736349 RepID=UPI001910C705|nr:DNA cytosine methyltransferase [Williamsia sp. Leaf354]